MNHKPIIWKSIQYPSMEYMSLYSDPKGVHIESVVVAVKDGRSFRLDYKIECDLLYRVRVVRVALYGGAEIEITSDGNGNWFDEHQQPLDNLKGCKDIDISATPLTNTLPIRRLAWQPGRTEKLRMVYFSVPEMAIHADEQHYTCLGQRSDGSTFHFHQISTGFAATIELDHDGLVSDYPELFTRVVT